MRPYLIFFLVIAVLEARPQPTGEAADYYPGNAVVDCTGRGARIPATRKSLKEIKEVKCPRNARRVVSKDKNSWFEVGCFVGEQPAGPFRLKHVSAYLSGAYSAYYNIYEKQTLVQQFCGFVQHGSELVITKDGYDAPIQFKWGKKTGTYHDGEIRQWWHKGILVRENGNFVTKNSFEKSTSECYSNDDAQGKIPAFLQLKGSYLTGETRGYSYQFCIDKDIAFTEKTIIAQIKKQGLRYQHSRNWHKKRATSNLYLFYEKSFYRVEILQERQKQSNWQVFKLKADPSTKRYMPLFTNKRPDVKPTTAGKKIYENSCSSCHGIEGTGKGPAAVALNPKPADFGQIKADYKAIVEVVTNGSPRVATMVAWKDILSKEQIAEVSKYVLYLRKKRLKRK